VKERAEGGERRAEGRGEYIILPEISKRKNVTGQSIKI